MKKIFSCILIIACLNKAHSQTKAVTETGDQVILYSDGTWKSAENKTSWETRLDTVKFTKPTTATFKVKSTIFDYAIWMDPKKWQFKKDETSDTPIEYKFTLTGQDAYAMVIAERIQVPLVSLKEVALNNARKAAPDIRLVKEEFRNINGKTVCLLQMEGTISGISFVYYGYYFSDPDGTVQFISYTSKNLFAKYKAEMDNLLNGFVKP